MTEKYRSLTVILDADYQTEDLSAIINAIRLIKGVAIMEWFHY